MTTPAKAAAPTESLLELRVSCGGPGQDVGLRLAAAAARSGPADGIRLDCVHEANPGCLELEEGLRYLARRRGLAFAACRAGRRRVSGPERSTRRAAPPTKPVRVLVTGSQGQIGRVMTRLLRDLGIKHAGLDVGEGEGAYLRCDLTKPDARALAEFCRPVTHVVHLASRISREKDLSGYAEQRRLNVDGTLALLDALPANLRHFAYASTMTVYGDCGERPVSEERPPEPSCVYALTKLAAERRLEEACARRGIPAALLRYSSVYGPGTPPDRAIPHMASRILAGEPPELRGGGRAVRDYLYIDDLCRATLAASLREARGVFNIGTVRGVSAAELARSLCRLAGSDAEPVPVDEPVDEQAAASLVYDISKARRELGWRPCVTFEAGLEAVIRELRSKGGAP